MKAQVTFLDNSGFIVDCPDVVMVFDYYRDPAHDLVKLLRKDTDKPVVFFVTHNHADHFNTDIFNLAQDHKRLYVLSNDIPTREIHDTMPIDWMSAGDTIEDLPGGIAKVQAYGSTDAGVSYVVTMSDGTTFFHAGDLNNWHWDAESTSREAHKAQEKFTVELDRIAEAHPSLDVAFFPVDTRQGENCSAGARQFLDTIAVGDFFPMHFKGSYETACDFDAYNLNAAVKARTTMHCLHKPGDTAEVDQ
ncbi:MAG: MBL fold metallo-hydrolase [Muribaculaceae bacterium]|nr:MBL fold metallo-hydrolase [Muribaculaceae bacterium]